MKTDELLKVEKDTTMENRTTLALEIKKKAETDDQFLQDFITAKSNEEIQAVLARNNIEATIEEIDYFIQQGQQIVAEALTADELSEDELETVAGGGMLRGKVIQAITYVGVAGIGVGMVALCAAFPGAAPAWIVLGKSAMVAAGTVGTYFTIKGYSKK